VTFGAGSLFVANAASSVPSSVVTIDPVRILDTRDPVNIGLPGPFVSAVSQKLQVTGSTVPAGSTGVLLNVTVVGPSVDGFLSVRPGDATGAPSTSSLNFTAGDIVPNSVQVGLPTAGANAGQIDITYDAFGTPGPTTDVLIEIVGYMVAGGGGATGPAGPAGPAANVVWAKVDADSGGATIIGGSGVSSVSRFSTGVYDVTFTSSIVGCGWFATRGDNADGFALSGEIVVEQAGSDPNILRVNTYTSAGVSADPAASDGFNVQVICP
jgi:hypothetical protein